MNIPDINDQSTAHALQQGMSFKEYARYQENLYLDEMRSLNVDLPNMIVRDSELIPEIIDFIQDIKEKEFAYEVNGSVYFDVKLFQEKGHQYNKFKSSYIDVLVSEEEQQIKTQNEGGKRNQIDFPL